MSGRDTKGKRSLYLSIYIGGEINDDNTALYDPQFYPLFAGL